MNSKGSQCISIVLLILATGIIILGVYQAINNNQFWVTSFSTCATLLIGVVFSFGLTQKYNDFRTKKAIYQELLKDLQLDIWSSEIIRITNDTPQESITMKKRSIQQKLNTLEESAEAFSLEKDIGFMKDKFLEYDNFVSDHITDLSFLAQAHTDLQRPLLLMDDRIYKARLKLYK